MFCLNDSVEVNQRNADRVERLTSANQNEPMTIDETSNSERSGMAIAQNYLMKEYLTH